jgi:hypothetical protein
MIPSHVYAVLGFDAEAEIVHLWNPLGDDFTPSGQAGLEAGYPVRAGRFAVPLAEFLQIFVAMTYESGRCGDGRVKARYLARGGEPEYREDAARERPACKRRSSRG